MGYMHPEFLFVNDSTGIDLVGNAAKFAGYEFSARNLAIGLALLIVSLKGVPESIAIVMVIRLLIEAQTLLITLLNNGGFQKIVMPLAFVVIEIFIIIRMAKIIQMRKS